MSRNAICPSVARLFSFVCLATLATPPVFGFAGVLHGNLWQIATRPLRSFVGEGGTWEALGWTLAGWQLGDTWATPGWDNADVAAKHLEP